MTTWVHHPASGGGVAGDGVGGGVAIVVVIVLRSLQVAVKLTNAYLEDLMEEEEEEEKEEEDITEEVEKEEYKRVRSTMECYIVSWNPI